MNNKHAIPTIYDPEISYSEKCKLMLSLCQSMAKHKGMTLDEMREFIIKKLNVDIKKLDTNPVGMLLLYEYLYSQRPATCRNEEKKRFH
ncbi:hypothetical protein L0N55_004672 [Salmonella enterica]|uniref:Uncharacterized protein n=1 Tax=Salmonella enterica TaxID=28901 RepID=A0A5T6J8F9_SALER|nr:hypothetical protein [Salmonella enterica]EAA4401905.1 hypothetical protein [Salmonella enterica subsp. enterica serovar London]EAA6918694.1 hypothetical protein [Salmonella enterica subsp. enterica serovar Mikawasima]EAW3954116.1 hypothetical protein [Salmonella enterica subsp. enterica]EBM9478767.1 hypothetical protein [Salmonella enterica subsp. enterica serovar Rubislaw]EBS0087861.1 hypothetical protein [Salmonella enterica subsp. enterica serovar Muenster]ECD2236986.1 hypothetical pro